MLKKLLIVLVLTLNLNALAMYEETDKQKHFAVSAVVGLAASNVAHYYGFDNHHSFWIGLAVTFTVGVGKELYDEHKYGGFSGDDMVANMLGGAIGSIPVFVIYEW